jgi:hypothetical protein
MWLPVAEGDDDVAPNMYDPQCHVRQIHHRYGMRSLGTSPRFVITGLKPQNHDSLIKQLQLAIDAIVSFMFKFVSLLIQAEVGEVKNGTGSLLRVCKIYSVQ